MIKFLSDSYHVIFLLIFIGMIVYDSISRRKANSYLKNAKKSEKENRYEDACYYYAQAWLTGLISRKNLEKNIKRLWTTRGPFEFKKFALDIQDRIDKLKQTVDTPEHCGESALAMELAYFQAVCKVVHQITSDQKTIGLVHPEIVKITRNWKVDPQGGFTLVEEITDEEAIQLNDENMKMDSDLENISNLKQNWIIIFLKKFSVIFIIAGLLICAIQYYLFKDGVEPITTTFILITIFGGAIFILGACFLDTSR